MIRGKTLISLAGIASLAVLVVACSKENPIATKGSTLNSEASVNGVLYSRFITTIMAPGGQGVSPGYACADNAGQSPLICNRTAVGPWEQYITTINGDGTYSFQSMANSKYVSKPSSADGPLIANSSTIGTLQKFTIETNTVMGPDWFWIYSVANQKCLLPQADKTLYASGTYYRCSFQVLQNKVLGASANTIAGNAYTWNSIYIAGGSCDVFYEPITFYIRASNVPSGTSVTLTCDGTNIFSAGISSGIEVSGRQCITPWYNLHNIRVQFNKSCVLDYVRWSDVPVGH